MKRLLCENVEDKFRHFIYFLASSCKFRKKIPSTDTNFDIKNYISLSAFIKMCKYEDAEIGMNIQDSFNNFVEENGIELEDKIYDKIDENLDYPAHLLKYIHRVFNRLGIDYELFKQYLYEYMIKLFNFHISHYFKINNGYVYCERGIDIDVACEDFKEYDGIGVCWSYREGYGTSEYCGGGGDEIILIGEVPISSVNWVKTFKFWMMNTEEYELRLKNNALVNIKSVYDTTCDEEFNFTAPLQVSTGSYYSE